MQNIKILYLFSQKIIFEDLLVGPLKLEVPKLEGP